MDREFEDSANYEKMIEKIKNWIEDRIYLVVETTAMVAIIVFVIALLILLIISLIGLVKTFLGVL